MRRWGSLVLASLMLLTASLIPGCLEEEGDEETGVVVSIAPQKEMVERVAGGLVDITVMVPPGESPHSYAPVPSQMKEVAKAEAYFKVGSGIDFEVNHMDEMREQNKDMRIFDCSREVELIDMDPPDHGDEGGEDPHVWLDPINTIKMVEEVFRGLSEIDAKNGDIYRENRDAYVAELEALNTTLAQRFENHTGEEFLVYHPSWGYFADRYDLVQLAIEEGGKKPGPAGVAAIIDQAKENNITVVFVSPQFDKSSADTIAREIGGEVIEVDPLAEDHTSNLRVVGEKLERGLAS